MKQIYIVLIAILLSLTTYADGIIHLKHADYSLGPFGGGEDVDEDLEINVYDANGEPLEYDLVYDATTGTYTIKYDDKRGTIKVVYVVFVNKITGRRVVKRYGVKG